MLWCSPKCTFFSLLHCVLHPGRLQNRLSTSVCQEMCKPAESHDVSDLHSQCSLQSMWRPNRTLFSLVCCASRLGTLYRGEYPQVRSRYCALGTMEATYRSKVLGSQQLLTITRQVKPPPWLHSSVHLLLRLYFRQSVLSSQAAGDSVQARVATGVFEEMCKPAGIMGACITNDPSDL